MTLASRIVLNIAIGVILGVIYLFAVFPKDVRMLMVHPLVIILATVLAAIIITSGAIISRGGIGVTLALRASIQQNLISIPLLLVAYYLPYLFLPYMPYLTQSYLHYMFFPAVVLIVGILFAWSYKPNITGRIAIALSLLQFAVLGYFIAVEGFHAFHMTTVKDFIWLRIYLDFVSLMCLKTMIEFRGGKTSVTPEQDEQTLLIANASTLAFLCLATIPAIVLMIAWS